MSSNPLILRMSGERVAMLLVALVIALITICTTIWSVADRRLDYLTEKNCIDAGGRWELVANSGLLFCDATKKE